MKKVTLKFKKQDFNNDYGDHKNCAISTALKRAGIEGATDAGIHIEKDCKIISEDKTYNKMTERVLGMYLYVDSSYTFREGIKAEEPKNFQSTILLNI